MARKYKKKYVQEASKIYAGKIKKRDGNWYGVYHIPLNLSEEALEWHLFNTVGSYQLILKEWPQQGGLMRKPYGESSKKYKRLDERNKLIFELNEKEKSKKTKPLLISDVINGQLKKRKYLRKDQSLSDRQLRRIVANTNNSK